MPCTVAVSLRVSIAPAVALYWSLACSFSNVPYLQLCLKFLPVYWCPLRALTLSHLSTVASPKSQPFHAAMVFCRCSTSSWALHPRLSSRRIIIAAPFRPLKLTPSLIPSLFTSWPVAQGVLKRALNLTAPICAPPISHRPSPVIVGINV